MVRALIAQLNKQPLVSTSEVITASQPCDAPCCQDNLEVFQVTDKIFLGKQGKCRVMEGSFVLSGIKGTHR